MSDQFTVTQIGIIHTSFTKKEDMPIQPSGGQEITAEVEVFPDFREGLEDLEGFSHIFLLYYLHKSSGYNLKVVPFLDTVPRGLFSTRAPRRPSPIGLSVVELVKREENILTVRGVDILDGSPLLDIKPYVPVFETEEKIRIGWLTGRAHSVYTKRSDTRFHDK